MHPTGLQQVLLQQALKPVPLGAQVPHLCGVHRFVQPLRERAGQAKVHLCRPGRQLPEDGRPLLAARGTQILLRHGVKGVCPGKLALESLYVCDCQSRVLLCQTGDVCFLLEPLPREGLRRSFHTLNLPLLGLSP